MGDSKAIDNLLDAYSPAVRRLVGDVRRYLRRCLPDASESVDNKARLIAYSHGPGYKGLVCTLILSTSGVKLGLVGSAASPIRTDFSRGMERSTGTYLCQPQGTFNESA